MIARTFGRSTFYAHFKSKDELLISGVHELRDTLDSAIQSERSRSKPHEDVIGFSMAMFQHASEYREVYHALLNTQGWPVFQQRLEEMFDEIIRRECKAEIQTIQRELGKDLSAMVGYVGSRGVHQLVSSGRCRHCATDPNVAGIPLAITRR